MELSLLIMLGLGITEVLIIMAVALLVVGPKKLPELARTLAKIMADVRKTSDEVKDSIMEETEELKSDIHEAKGFEELKEVEKDLKG